MKKQKKIIIFLMLIALLAISIFLGKQWMQRQLDAYDKIVGPRPSPIPCPTSTCRPNPDSRRIAFSSNRFDQGQEIHVMNADGTCVTQLTDFSDWFTENEARRPTWSPNGAHILFELYNDESPPNLDLYTITAGGDQVKQLTQGGTNCEARWSPNGSKIAFKSDRDGEAALYIMDADGLNKRRLTNISALECRWNAGIQESDYAWSPDGRRIAFTGIDPMTEQQDVYMIDIENNELTNLTNHPAKDRMITWWPTEDKLLFLSDRLSDQSEITNLLTLYIMDADGTDTQRVVDLAPIPTHPPGNIGSPNEDYVRGWVPTTTLHLVLSNIYEQQTYILDVACALENPPKPGILPKGCYRAFDKPLFESSAGNQETVLVPVGEIYWSAGDPKLTFRLTEYLGDIPDGEIVVVGYDGTEATNLTGCSADDQDPAWSPEEQ